MFKNAYRKPYDLTGYFTGYHQDATYFDLSQDRIALIFKEIQSGKVKTILDIGYFPGLIGRLIKDKYPEVYLHGIGKCNETTRESFPWYNDITDADFDPFYGSQKIPKIEKSFDLILGIEIIEHLISPLPFLQFIADHVSE
jgi:2-polyprenyl-3-methyl-5-hydroxy-6-metoxy-1,4-benzoquinol methylase